ncbi:hypothetical protein BCR43DRAFT_526062 [Syncephalastrum racemosum]|uniref:Uncharacterized protein n=1 Tax=Syncephalastrum racemosum TaxID=13706 RepID=A0A1X2H8Q4_SYNRA|nr:hypothetical protein BCR43DRAFT_526062 [Syncephalastrum racemosum]
MPIDNSNRLQQQNDDEENPLFYLDPFPDRQQDGQIRGEPDYAASAGLVGRLQQDNIRAVPSHANGSDRAITNIDTYEVGATILQDMSRSSNSNARLHNDTTPDGALFYFDPVPSQVVSGGNSAAQQNQGEPTRSDTDAAAYGLDAYSFGGNTSSMMDAQQEQGNRYYTISSDEEDVIYGLDVSPFNDERNCSSDEEEYHLLCCSDHEHGPIAPQSQGQQPSATLSLLGEPSLTNGMGGSPDTIRFEQLQWVMARFQEHITVRTYPGWSARPSLLPAAIRQIDSAPIDPATVHTLLALQNANGESVSDGASAAESEPAETTISSPPVRNLHIVQSPDKVQADYTVYCVGGKIRRDLGWTSLILFTSPSNWEGYRIVGALSKKKIRPKVCRAHALRMAIELLPRDRPILLCSLRPDFYGDSNKKPMAWRKAMQEQLHHVRTLIAERPAPVYIYDVKSQMKSNQYMSELTACMKRPMSVYQAQMVQGGAYAKHREYFLLNRMPALGMTLAAFSRAMNRMSGRHHARAIIHPPASSKYTLSKSNNQGSGSSYDVDKYKDHEFIVNDDNSGSDREDGQSEEEEEDENMDGIRNSRPVLANPIQKRPRPEYAYGEAGHSPDRQAKRVRHAGPIDGGTAATAGKFRSFFGWLRSFF